MATLYPTPLDKLVTRIRLPRRLFVLAVGVILLLLAATAALLDGAWQHLFIDGSWRNVLLPTVIVVYILALSGPMARHRSDAVEALRQVILIDDESFDGLVQEVSDIDDRSEAIAFLVGAAFGVWAYGPWQPSEGYVWLKGYMVIAGVLMYGLLAWIAFTAMATTKLEAALHEQPMEIDIFNLGPFEPIGRYSLFASLAFVGGTVLSIFFLTPAQQAGLDFASLAFYAILGLVAVLVFFLGMRHTHRVLKVAKGEEQWEVQERIVQTFRAMKEEGADLGALSTELGLWTSYEERLNSVRTWPYNTAMLRAVFVSVLFPIIASQAQRLIASLLFN